MGLGGKNGILQEAVGLRAPVDDMRVLVEHGGQWSEVEGELHRVVLEFTKLGRDAKIRVSAINFSEVLSLHRHSFRGVAIQYYGRMTLSD